MPRRKGVKAAKRGEEPDAQPTVAPVAPSAPPVALERPVVHVGLVPDAMAPTHFYCRAAQPVSHAMVKLVLQSACAKGFISEAPSDSPDVAPALFYEVATGFDVIDTLTLMNFKVECVDGTMPVGTAAVQSPAPAPAMAPAAASAATDAPESPLGTPAKRARVGTGTGAGPSTPAPAPAPTTPAALAGPTAAATPAGTAGNAPDEAELALLAALQAYEGNAAKQPADVTLTPVQQRVADALGWASYRRLYDFQKQGVEDLLSRNGRALLADDMGLGKTVQALAVAAVNYPQAWPLLIICPPLLKFVWETAIREWLRPDMQPAPEDVWVIGGAPDINKLTKKYRIRPPLDRPHVLIITYAMVTSRPELATLLSKYKFLICDESHALKGKKTQRTEGVRKLVRGAGRNLQHVLFITGTPITNRPIDLWPQVDILCEGFLGSYDDYGVQYCVTPGQQPYKYLHAQGIHVPNFGGAAAQHKLEELCAKLRGKLMVRRTKAQVALQLPKNTRIRWPTQIAAHHATALKKQMDELKALQAEMQAEPDSLDIKREWQQAVTKAYTTVGPYKVKGVMDLVDWLLKGDDAEDGHQKVLVFAHHKEVLDGCAESLTKQKVGFVRIDGSMTNNQRTAALAEFKRNSQVGVFLLSITTASAGLSLNEATACVFAELSWTPAHMSQAENRMHRIGQTRPVFSYYCVVPGSTDDWMWKSLHAKEQAMSSLLDTPTPARAAGGAAPPAVGGSATGPSGATGPSSVVRSLGPAFEF